jgi:xylose isomerase
MNGIEVTKKDSGLEHDMWGGGYTQLLSMQLRSSNNYNTLEAMFKVSIIYNHTIIIIIHDYSVNIRTNIPLWKPRFRVN